MVDYSPSAGLWSVEKKSVQATVVQKKRINR